MAGPRHTDGHVPHPDLNHLLKETVDDLPIGFTVSLAVRRLTVDDYVATAAIHPPGETRVVLGETGPNPGSAVSKLRHRLTLAERDGHHPMNGDA